MRLPVGAIEKLRSLKAGWYDGSTGKPFKARHLDWLTDRFESLCSEHLPLPWVYPLPDGRVRCEWRSANYEALLDIDLHTQQGDWLSFIKAEDHEAEQTLHLEQADSWQWIHQELKGRLNQACHPSVAEIKA